LEGGGHERNKNTNERRCQGIISYPRRLWRAAKKAFNADASGCTPNTRMLRCGSQAVDHEAWPPVL
jgi:hypothetical protein